MSMRGCGGVYVCVWRVCVAWGLLGLHAFDALSMRAAVFGLKSRAPHREGFQGLQGLEDFKATHVDAPV